MNNARNKWRWYFSFQSVLQNKDSNLIWPLVVLHFILECFFFFSNKATQKKEVGQNQIIYWKYVFAVSSILWHYFRTDNSKLETELNLYRNHNEKHDANFAPTKNFECQSLKMDFRSPVLALQWYSTSKTEESCYASKVCHTTGCEISKALFPWLNHYCYTEAVQM